MTGRSAFARARHGVVRFERIVRNMGWLFVDRGVRLVGGLIVTAFVARYLGPEDFGVLRYAMAFAGLFAVLAGLGLNNVLVRELVRRPDDAGAILGNAAVLRLVAGGAAATLVAIIAAILKRDEPLIAWMCAIVGLTLIVRASEVIKAWFEYRVSSGHVVRAGIVCFVLASALKLALVFGDAPLVAFAWALLFEALLLAAGLLWLQQRHLRDRVALAFDAAGAVQLLRESWPLMLSALAVMVYMKTDIIMLGEMRGNADVGVYAIAVQLSEIWHSVPMIVAASFFPAMIGLRDRDPVRYAQRLRQLLSLMVLLALGIALVFVTLAPWIVTTLYGDAYAASAAVVRVHVWALVFVFIGVVGNRWYLAEGLQRLMFHRALLGAVVNVLLNLLLIPRYGPTGAATATVVSCAVSAYFADALGSASRALFRAKSDALVLRGLNASRARS